MEQKHAVCVEAAVGAAKHAGDQRQIVYVEAAADAEVAVGAGLAPGGWPAVPHPYKLVALFQPGGVDWRRVLSALLIDRLAVVIRHPLEVHDRQQLPHKAQTSAAVA